MQQQKLVLDGWKADLVFFEMSLFYFSLIFVFPLFDQGHIRREATDV